MKYGKLPARGAINLKFSKYADLSTLPTPPESFGHSSLISDWGMLGNDEYGDCAFAGSAHEIMLWNAEATRDVTFTVDNVLSDYSALTGFNKDNPSTDQGTDVQQLAKYRQNTGLIDSQGNRHKVAAYVSLTPGDLNELYTAIYLFGSVGIGFKVPNYWQDEFNQGQPWDYKRRFGFLPPTIEGGHYVPGVGRQDGMLQVITWGAVQNVTEQAYEKLNDETVCYLSTEFLKNGKSLEGFDLDQLQADLGALA